MRGALSTGCVLVLLGVVAACGREATSGASAPQSAAAVPGSLTSPVPESVPSPTASSVNGRGPLVVFLGDSLTAGYGLSQDQGFPARVAELLRDAGHPIRILDAGVSGDTSAGGLSRVDWLLRQRPAVVVIGLGANDGLRGLEPDETASNLRAIIARVRAAGARVLLLGMKLPPNYGVEYTARFEAIYPELARETGVPCVPFLLEGVAGDPSLNLDDGIHPSAQGQLRVARNVLPWLAPLVRDSTP